MNAIIDIFWNNKKKSIRGSSVNLIITITILFLVLFVVGFAALAVAVIALIALGVYAYKTAKLLIALLNAAIKEPEDKIVKKVRKLATPVQRRK